MKLMKLFLTLFGAKFELGSLTLVTSGTQVIKIKTNFKPSKVWISPNHSRTVATCQADVDSFDVEYLHDGFFLIARLNSDFREIEWIAIN